MHLASIARIPDRKVEADLAQAPLDFGGGEEEGRKGAEFRAIRRAPEWERECRFIGSIWNYEGLVIAL